MAAWRRAAVARRESNAAVTCEHVHARRGTGPIIAKNGPYPQAPGVPNIG